MIKRTYFKTLREVYDYSTVHYAKSTVSQFVDGSCKYTFSSFKERCDALSELLCDCGIQPADKVAILSESHPNWTVAFLCATAFGRVAVPILPDSSANEVSNILAHSESKVLFVSEKNLPKISADMMESLQLVVNLNSLQVLKRPQEGSVQRGATAVPQYEDLAAIIYTSGTSGNAKGVMLAQRCFCANITASPDVQPLGPKDTFVSVLPMAHTYELSLGVLYPFASGTRVCYMNKMPTPSNLLEAMSKIRPTVMIVVPLILEKVYRKNVVPTIKNSKFLTYLEKHAPKLLAWIICRKLVNTFGGKIKTFAVGGAKLDSEVEAFLKRGHFPYAIGYGMTEMAPLICAADKTNTAVGSTGPAMYGVEVKLDKVNPQTGEGEIITRGPNLMMGYYKDAERTAEVISPDGWLHTKDLAVIDEKGRYYIKGRLGNMILGASGENIYPEEIEMFINGMDNVEDSLVLSRTGHLVALIKLVNSTIEKLADEEYRRTLEGEFLSKINAGVNKASQISAVEFVKEPFIKTATQKIRRFLYK